MRADGAVQGFTTRDGEYFPGFRNAIFGYQAAGAGGDANRDNSDKFKAVAGVDQETALFVWLQAPPGVRMVTPVTGLLFANGSDPTKLKTQLGITGSLFGMVANPDLSTYDAVAEAASGDGARAADAARMAAANIRALAINTGLSAIGSRGEAAASLVSIGYNDGGAAPLSNCLRDAPNQFIFTNDRMVSVAQCFTRNPSTGAVPTLRPATWQAIAHLVNAYAAALPVRIETSAERARWMLGLRGYLVPAISQVASADSDSVSATALAVSTQTIINETARYVDYYGYNATGLFMPGPDFLTIASGTTRSIDLELLRQTDFQFGAPNGGLNIGGTIRSVSVPAQNAGEVTATFSTAGISVVVANGFRGVTWFDYVTRSDAGEDRTARVYIRAY